MSYHCRACVLIIGLLTCLQSYAYPLDGEPESGIGRLQGYRVAQDTPGRAKLPPGALLGFADIRLGLVGYDGPDFDARPEDADFSVALQKMFANEDPSYSLVLVDISDPADIRWAGIRPDLKKNPGSVGKVLSMLAVFDALARAFPDPAERRRVLSTTRVSAGDWVLIGIHQVPRWNPELGRNMFSIPAPDDVFLLSEWIDHAISASANGAGAVIWREAMLIRHFGSRYPVDAEEAAAFFRNTPRAELGQLARDVTVEPMIAAGLDTDNFIQGSFWTRVSKQKVPGTQSWGTAREFARYMFRLEQGRLVDEWSSLEMKRYLYMTKRRYRYVYAPELNDAAVYFKSGSLYECVPEENFRCGKYEGNKRNLMNSVTIVEAPATQAVHRYIAALTTNVLRFNSAWDHSRIGAAVHRLVLDRKPVALRSDASADEIREAGKSD